MTRVQLIEDEAKEIGVITPIIRLLSIFELFDVCILNRERPRLLPQELIDAISTDAEEPCPQVS